jgi:signal transduction histidine kinase
LGLSLAKRIVEDFHKGKIHVIHSVVDEGSTIEISIPEK